jgi:hypothetical protein
MSLCRTAWQSWLVFVKFLAPSLASLFDSDSLAVVGIHVFSREVSLLSAAPAAEMCWPRVSAAELKFNRSAAKCATGPDSCQTFPSASFVAHPVDPATGHQYGHEPLTRNFTSASMLALLKTDLVWLREQVLSAIRRGEERGAIHQANLIPPGLIIDQPDVYQPYLILREHVIDRLYNQNVGYWHPDLQGLEHLTHADQAALLVDYLGVTEGQLVKTIERLTADGKYELAASLLESSGKRFEGSPSVARAKRLVYLKLMEKHQNTDPFKFIIYSSRIGEQTPQVAVGK